MCAPVVACSKLYLGLHPWQGAFSTPSSFLVQDFLGIEAFGSIQPTEVEDGSFLWLRRFESPAEVPEHLLVFK